MRPGLERIDISEFPSAHWNGSHRASRNITGLRAGRLEALERVGTIKGDQLWAWACSCGAIVRVKMESVVCGDTRSCGCLKLDIFIKMSTVHGHSGGKQKPKHPLYAT